MRSLNQRNSFAESIDGGVKKITQGILFLAALIILSPSILQAQDFTRTISKKAEFVDRYNDDNKFRVMNINGSVDIEAYDGDKIEMTVNESIRGTSSEIEQGKKELEYKLERRGNLILAYLDAPFITFRYEGDEVHYHVDRDKDTYRFLHDVKIKVPRDILLEASTINKGMLSVTGSFKSVEASNVNGALELNHLTSKTEANTVNGDITITYDKAPTEDSEYQTVNGTIEISTPADLSADVHFKSLHGDLYTNFENIQQLKPQVKKATHSNRSSVTYQVDKFSPIRIGSGGPSLRFQVLNGDVYIRKQ